MNFEEAQRHWQTPANHSPEDAASQAAVDVAHRFAALERSLAWRDAREVGAALLVAAVALYLGYERTDWGHFLLAAGALFVGVFLIVDRLRQRRSAPSPEHSTHSFLVAALAQVEHQIWLLRHVLAWYIAPIALGATAAVTSTALRSTSSSTLESGILAALWTFSVLVIAAVAWAIHRLNQNVVRNDLEPRRQELLAIVADLERAAGDSPPAG